MKMSLISIPRTLSALFLISSSHLAAAAEMEAESDIKFAFYSSAWGENTDDGLRLIAHNQTNAPIRLDKITFEKPLDAEDVSIEIGIEVPAMAYAGAEFEYLDLLRGDECITRTMAENWKLVEVSNYTLNPSVRNLIIENTDSFRIYQCVENVTTNWTNKNTDVSFEKTEWVLFHFESRAEL